VIKIIFPTKGVGVQPGTEQRERKVGIIGGGEGIKIF